MSAYTDSRELILEILLQITRDGEYSHIALKHALDQYQYLDKKEECLHHQGGEWHAGAYDRVGLYPGSILESEGE